jgi:hypothetical protein
VVCVVVVPQPANIISPIKIKFFISFSLGQALNACLKALAFVRDDRSGTLPFFIKKFVHIKVVKLNWDFTVPKRDA